MDINSYNDVIIGGAAEVETLNDALAHAQKEGEANKAAADKAAADFKLSRSPVANTKPG